jgi:hypothetical protein
VGGVVLEEPTTTRLPQVYRRHLTEINQLLDWEQYQPEAIPVSIETPDPPPVLAPPEEGRQHVGMMPTPSCTGGQVREEGDP